MACNAPCMLGRSSAGRHWPHLQILSDLLLQTHRRQAADNGAASLQQNAELLPCFLPSHGLLLGLLLELG